MDFVPIPLNSLNILKENSTAELTMVMNQSPDDTKCKIDLVSEIASKNGIELTRIDGISRLPPNEKYDLVIFNPILYSGCLNSKILRELDESKLTGKYFSPQKVTIWISLIESEDLVKNYKMLPLNQTMEFKNIAQGMNTYAVNHVQNIRLDQIKYRHLSQMINVYSIDFFDKSDNLCQLIKDELEIKIENSGNVHAILYWFELLSQDETKESTLNHELFDNAAILLDEPFMVDPKKEDYLSVEITVENYLIDMKLT